MAFGAAALPKKTFCPASSVGGGLLGVELAEQVQLRRRREIEDIHELGHEMHLAAALQDVNALLGGDHRIAVEIGRPLLELREVLHAPQRPLRAEKPLDVHAAQRRRVEPVAELLRPESPTRCVAALVWPLTWQSKQVTPMLGCNERRSSVALNCCWGKA